MTASPSTTISVCTFSSFLFFGAPRRTSLTPWYPYSILDQIQESQMVGNRGNDLQTQIQLRGGKIDAERREKTCPSSCCEEKDFMRP